MAKQPDKPETYKGKHRAEDTEKPHAGYPIGTRHTDTSSRPDTGKHHTP